MVASLTSEWLEGLALAKRRPPELYQPHDRYDGGPHAAALRVAFEDLGLAAVFCIEDVPTVGFLVLGGENHKRVNEVHRALWNQGLMTLLLVFSGDVLRAYSLARLPVRPIADGNSADGGDNSANAKDSRLVATFERIRDALALKELVLGVESGRLWAKHPDAFDSSERVDQVLLNNLMKAFYELKKEFYDLKKEHLKSNAAQALLMQTMFIAYLEDRGVVLEPYFREATNRRAGSFSELLETEDVGLLEKLFKQLRKDFNGDIFLAPCAFDESDEKPRIRASHFRILNRFRTGQENMETGQFRFWGYDFRYIPVVLLSAVYDRFLGEDESARRKEGAYYTPMFLVDTVVSQVWDALTEEQRAKGRVLDPACGSGIFLVRLIQRFVEYRRARRHGRALSWNELVAIAERLHGRDVNASALRVAAFSIYIALLEYVTPPDIRSLMAKGKMLPELWGHSLVPASFFQMLAESYDIVIGNPPWTSRRGEAGGATQWCEDNELPCPSDEAAWGFIWRAQQLLSSDGIAGFLLPAMGVLHNHAKEAVEARQRLLRESRVERVINFADLSFQLFDGADRPAAFVMYRAKRENEGAYRFDYWCPKADLNLRLKRVLTLSLADRTRLRSDFASKEPQTFKRRLWMRRPDEKLLQYLTALPRLSALVDEYETLVRRLRPSRKSSSESKGGSTIVKEDLSRKGVLAGSRHGWVIGQGFKPVSHERLRESKRNGKKYETTTSEVVGLYPFFRTEAFRILALPTITEEPWGETLVHRAGFSEGFIGPHILIPHGVERDVGRVRATYTEQNVAFRHSIQAIRFPDEQRARAKLLTAILNSRLAAWFYFHETANLGTDRAKVHQAELLTLPFPEPSDLAEPKVAEATAKEIVGVFDDALEAANDVLESGRPFLEELDGLVFRYFGLSKDEIAVVDDTLDFVIPAMQPREDDFPSLWRPCQYKHRADYASTLSRALGQWLESGTQVRVVLAGMGADLAVLCLRLGPRGEGHPIYSEVESSDVSEVLSRIWEMLPVSLPGNFQLLPDLRVFLDGDMYVVKPRQLRYWLQSSALADADEIATDLHQASVMQRRGAQVLHADR